MILKHKYVFQFMRECSCPYKHYNVNYVIAYEHERCVNKSDNTIHLESLTLSRKKKSATLETSIGLVTSNRH